MRKKHKSPKNSVGGITIKVIIFYGLVIISIILLLKNLNVEHLFERDTITQTPSPTVISSFQWKK